MLVSSWGGVLCRRLLFRILLVLLLPRIPFRPAFLVVPFAGVRLLLFVHGLFP